MTHPTELTKRLLDRGQELYRAPPAPVPFTDFTPANALVNDIKGHPHAFVLACIMDQQIDYQRAWRIPYEIQQRLGTFEFPQLARLTLPRVTKLMSKPVPLHRFPQRMARFLHSGVKRIQNQYAGDASRIWQGAPSSAVVVLRFLEFDGVGPKIATMAANILARQFKIEMSDYCSIDISVDVHVRRVFTRLGLVSPKASTEELIYTARAMAPSFPGLLDLPVWDIGRAWCRPRVPLCRKCYMQDVCPSSSKLGTR